MESLIHSGIKCSICQKFPIVGIRYKCLQCNSFDLCEECEKWPATAVHHRRPLETFTNFDDMLAAAYDWQNLESVCQKCHDKLHKELDSHNFARNKELAARRNEDRASSILSLFED